MIQWPIIVLLSLCMYSSLNSRLYCNMLVLWGSLTLIQQITFVVGKDIWLLGLQVKNCRTTTTTLQTRMQVGNSYQIWACKPQAMDSTVLILTFCNCSMKELGKHFIIFFFSQNSLLCNWVLCLLVNRILLLSDSWKS